MTLKNYMSGSGGFPKENGLLFPEKMNVDAQ